MTIIEILNYVNTSLKSSFSGAVEAIKKHTFSVKFPDIQKVSLKFPDVQKVSGKVDVKFPDVQRIGGKVEVINLPALGGIIEKLEDIKSELDDKGVEIKNFPEFPKKIEITNLPKEKEVNFDGLESKLDMLIASIKKLPTKFPDFPKPPVYPEQKEVKFPKSFSVDNLEGLKSDNPKEYVPVRLTDGDEFYKAIEEFYQQVSSAVTFTDSQNKKTSALVDEDRHVQVDVLTMPNFEVSSVEVNNLPTTFPLPEEQIIALAPTPAIEGFSTEAKQDALAEKIDTLIAELETKPSTGDIQMSEVIPMLRSILVAIANPSYVDKSANQMRAQITGSLTTLTTCTTVTNLTNIGSFQSDHLQRMNNMTAWATNIRSLIT